MKLLDELLELSGLEARKGQEELDEAKAIHRGKFQDDPSKYVPHLEAAVKSIEEAVKHLKAADESYWWDDIKSYLVRLEEVVSSDGGEAGLTNLLKQVKKKIKESAFDDDDDFEDPPTNICPECEGKGKDKDGKKCENCNGAGEIFESKKPTTPGWYAVDDDDKVMSGPHTEKEAKDKIGKGKVTDAVYISDYDVKRLNEAKKEEKKKDAKKDSKAKADKKPAKKKEKKKESKGEAETNTDLLRDLPTDWLDVKEPEEKIEVPAKVKSKLKDKIADAEKKLAMYDKINQGRSMDFTDDRMDGFKDTVDAMNKLLALLDDNSVEGIKHVAIHLMSLPNPMMNQVPREVINFITKGTPVSSSLKDYYNTVRAEDK